MRYKWSGMGRGKNDQINGWLQAAYYGQDNNDYGYNSTTDNATVSNINASNHGMIASLSYSAATSMKDINAL